MESENVVEPAEVNGAVSEPPQPPPIIPITFSMDVNLGINLSIALILIIFSGLLFLPSKMLLDTSYEVNNGSLTNASFTTNFLNSMEFRKRKLCPGLNYKYWMMTPYFSNYDRNCTYSRKRVKQIQKTTTVDSIREKNVCIKEKKQSVITFKYNGTVDEVKITRPKSISVTGHILAMMLVVSAVTAFVEVVRIRFLNAKESSAVENAGSRKGSTIKLMNPGRFLQRPPMRSTRSVELQGKHHQESICVYRGTCDRGNFVTDAPGCPPLLRRSSFPIYPIIKAGDSPTRCPTVRRPSTNAEAAGDVLPRRAHLLRRH